MRQKVKQLTGILLSLVLMLGLMLALGTTAWAKMYSEDITVDLQPGDILEPGAKYNADHKIIYLEEYGWCEELLPNQYYQKNYTRELQFGPYLKVFGNGALEAAAGTTVKYVYPYYNGEKVDSWIVVSVESNTITLKGYKKGQNNNPYPAAVSYRQFGSNGEKLDDGMLAADEGILIESDTRKWANGKTYVADGTVTIDSRVKVNGTVNLILLDGAELTVDGGISVNENNTLNIYTGSTTADNILGNGRLITINCPDYYAGIGGEDGYRCGNVNIHGGRINASGGSRASGIGSGGLHYGGRVTIYGGIVNARGGNGGAGIGGGWNGDEGGSTVIYGGLITAIGRGSSMGIGGGERADTPGTVAINTDASILAGESADSAGPTDRSAYMNNHSQRYVKIASLCAVTYDANGAISGSIPTDDNQYQYDDSVVALDITGNLKKGKYTFGGWNTAEDGSGTTYQPGESFTITENTTLYVKWDIISVPYMDWNGTALVEKSGDEACRNYDLVTSDTAAFENGVWYVADGSVSVENRISVKGTAHLILADGAALNAKQGITLGEGSSLILHGQSGGIGALTALGNLNGAGIGGTDIVEAGTLIVNGVNVNATGGPGGAGIGGGRLSSGGTVTVNGGTVTANGGEGGAGIGGGWTSSGGTVTVNGGTVTANGGYKAAGIGGGYEWYGCTVTINGGTVTANGGEGGAGIGGDIAGPGSVTINGGTVTASGSEGISVEDITLDYKNPTDSITASSYCTDNLVIAEGKCFTVNGTEAVYGKLMYDQLKPFADKTLVPACRVKVADDIEHGTVSASPAVFALKDLAGADKTVTLTATPDANYTIGSVSYNDGAEHTITPESGVYAFTMPEKDVTATAVFLKSLDTATVDDIDDQTYTGSAITPGVTVKDGDTTLTYDTDYTVSYENNVNAASRDAQAAPAVIITGKGSYGGRVKKTFTIARKDITITAADQSVEYGGSIAASLDKVSVTGGGLAGGHSLSSITLGLAQGSETSAVGEYPGAIVPSAAKIVSGTTDVTANYNIAYVNGKLTVTKAKAKVTTVPRAIPGMKYTGAAQNLVMGGQADTAMEYTLGSNSTTAPTAGYTNIVPSARDANPSYYVWYRAKADDNHTAGDPAVLTAAIGKAPLTVTAKNQRIHVGDSIPSLVGADFYTVAGLLGRDTLTAAPTLAYQKNGTAAVPDNTRAGTYDIVPYGAAASANYTISYAKGTLTIAELEGPVITGADLVLNGTLDFRFYVALPANFDAGDARMSFTVHGRSINVPFAQAETAEDGRKIFPCPVYSIEMAEPVTAVFHYTKDGQSKTVTRTASIKEYLEALDKAEGKTQELVDLIAAVRNYGHYIQPYLARLHNFTIGEGGYTEMPAAGSITPLEALDDYKTRWHSKNTELLDSVGYYNTFNTSTILHVQIKLKTEKTVTATVDGANWTVRKLGGNVYAIEIPDIAANDLGKSWRVVFKAGETEICDMEVSALTYVSAVLASGRDQADEKAALTAFYEYYTAAKAYPGN